MVAASQATAAPAEADVQIPSAKPADDAKKKQAKALFKTGLVFFENGDLERALEFFLQSRDAYPSIHNTSNAALCLEKLGRYGEALELFDVLLVVYRDRFSEAERVAIGPKLAALRARVGSLIVAANVAGLLVIDGRPRGKLPRRQPLRLLPGLHQLRIVADGYGSYEKNVRVALGRSSRIDASLEPLTSVGQLRVEDPRNNGATVYVDGVAMGTVPWQGTLGPGPHLVWTSRGNMGSAPRRAIVVEGQQSLITVRSGTLGPPLSLRVTPKEAQIQLGDVTLGHGRWRGRLPHGAYRIELSEAGYHPVARSLEIDTSRDEPVSLAVTLKVDPDHPRWPKGVTGQFSVDAFAGYSYAPSLRGEDRKHCSERCPERPGAHGGLAGFRAAYRFASGTALELAGGYAALSQQSERSLAASDPALGYHLRDDILVHGPFVALGASQRAPVTTGIALTARLGVGVMFSRARNSIQGTASDGQEQITITIAGANTAQRASAVFVHSELTAEWSFGSWRLGGGVHGTLFVTSGPELSDRSVLLPPPPDNCFDPKATPSRVGCSPSGVALPDETAHEMFFAFGPQLSLGYVF
jgi:hypothetical protein